MHKSGEQLINKKFTAKIITVSMGKWRPAMVAELLERVSNSSRHSLEDPGLNSRSGLQCDIDRSEVEILCRYSNSRGLSETYLLGVLFFYKLVRTLGYQLKSSQHRSFIQEHTQEELGQSSSTSVCPRSTGPNTTHKILHTHTPTGDTPSKMCRWVDG